MAISPYISLFSGAGGLDLAVRLAVPSARCVGYVENEVTAAEILAARFEDGTLDEAPVWSDARQFPSALYREQLAGHNFGVVGGFPCPDFSVAGKRAGVDGDKGGLWFDLARAIRELGPGWCYLENVSGLLVPHRSSESEWVLPAGLWFVLGELASMGFDCEWGCLRASSVGASHQRLRIFILANRRCERDERRGIPRVISLTPGAVEDHGEQRQWSGDAPVDSESSLEHTTCAQQPRSTRNGSDATGGGGTGTSSGSHWLTPKSPTGGGNASE